MREVFRFPPLTPFVKKLLIGLFASAVVAVLLTRFGVVPAVQLLALSPGVGIETVWQIFTYPLVTEPSGGGIFFLLLNLVFLWLMMAPFEARFGQKATMQLSIVSTVAGAVPFVVVSLVAPALPIAGPSPLFMGTIAAYALSFPKDSQLSFFGVLPMKPRTMMYVFVGLFALMRLADGNVAGVFLPIGSAAGGAAYIRWLMKPPSRPKPKRKRRDSGRRRAPAGWQVIEGGDDDDDKPKWLN